MRIKKLALEINYSLAGSLTRASILHIWSLAEQREIWGLSKLQIIMKRWQPN